MGGQASERAAAKRKPAMRPRSGRSKHPGFHEYVSLFPNRHRRVDQASRSSAPRLAAYQTNPVLMNAEGWHTVPANEGLGAA
jgi:hypothetical protein